MSQYASKLASPRTSYETIQRTTIHIQMRLEPSFLQEFEYSIGNLRRPFSVVSDAVAFFGKAIVVVIQVRVSRCADSGLASLPMSRSASERTPMRRGVHSMTGGRGAGTKAEYAPCETGCRKSHPALQISNTTRIAI